jgi:RNA polymerase sigma-70 factor, ECF subfamily
VDSAGSDKLDALVARARQRDEAALTELFQGQAQRLLESVRAELGDRLRQRLESQDVMQQVYLDALGAIDQFVDRGHDSFFRWLRGIALNRICDVDRRAFGTRKRGGEVRAGDLGNDASMIRLLDRLTDSMASPSAVADLDDRIGLLRRALQALSEEQRDVIQFRYLNQLSVSETAVRMNRSERAVRSLCVRALIRLRELLADAL